MKGQIKTPPIRDGNYGLGVVVLKSHLYEIDLERMYNQQPSFFVSLVMNFWQKIKHTTKVIFFSIPPFFNANGRLE